MGYSDFLMKLSKKGKSGNALWKCPQCSYLNSSALGKVCQNCGTDIAGNTGNPPTTKQRI